MGHDLLTIYFLKGIEYLLAVAYLPLFVLFWRFATPKAPAVAVAAVGDTAPGWADQLADYFRLPGDLFHHPGHAWARVEGDTVVVGLNDFAQRLVGRIDRLRLPAAGTELAQSRPAFSIVSGGRSVAVLAPVGGTVVEVNHEAASDPGAVKQSPYGRGWLLRVRSPQMAAQLKALMRGELAQRWMDTVWEQLNTEAAATELGAVYQDGGTPVDGMAQGLSPEHWDRVARRYLLTEDESFEGGSDA